MSVPVAEGPQPITQFLDATGTPLAGGLIYTYAAGTNTPQPTYSDYTGTVQNSNPVVLDSAGRAQIWFTASAYKIVVCDANNAQQYVVDGFSVGLFANGNNSFTGNNTFAGSTTFNGAVIINNGGSLNGTFSGNPNFSGNPTFSSATFTGVTAFPGGITTDSITGTITTGGTLNIFGAAATANDVGENVVISGGNGNAGGNGAGGNATLVGGQGGLTGGSGGSAHLSGGNGVIANGAGGDIFVEGGFGTGSGIGGSVHVQAGMGGASNALGGGILLVSGEGGTGANGGGISLTSGMGGAGANGGDIDIASGVAGAGGADGIVSINGVRFPWLFSNVVQQTVTNTNVETTLYTVNIPANSLVLNQVLRISMRGLRSSVSGDSSALELRVRVNGTLILGAQDSTYITTSARPLSLDASLGVGTLGISGQLYVVGGNYIYYPDGSDGVVTPVSGGNSSGYVSLNTTVNNVLTITAQWGVASTNEIFIATMGQVQ